MIKHIGIFALLLFVVFSINSEEAEEFSFPPQAVLNASLQGDEETLRLILQAGTDRDVRTSLGDTALHLAVYQPNPNVIWLLLEHGFDSNARNNMGNTPLHNAVSANNENAVSLLLRYRANRDIRNSAGISPLEKARQEGKMRLVRLFR